MIVDQKLNKSVVGVYLMDRIVDGMQLATSSRPNWFRRVMIRILFGWKWVTIKKLKKMK